MNPPTPPTTTQVTEQEENTLTPTTSQPLQRTRSENTSQLSNPLIPSASSNPSGQNTNPQETDLTSRLGSSELGSDTGTLTPQGQWKTHSDRTLGIEFQYPPNWEVKEKTNRFETGPDLTVEEMSGFDSFGVTTVDDLSSDLVDAEFFASVGQNRLTEGEDNRLIEGVEEHTPIGGEEAYSFTYTQGSELDFLEAVQEAITVIHDDRGYIFAFTGTTSTFDDPENVEIRERVLGSLQFLDGGESDSGEDEDSTGDEEEEENKEDNDGGNGVNLFN